jgi:DNA-binding response OmpR family regulator
MRSTTPAERKSSRPVVLVVDDDPAITKLVSLCLRDEDFEVVTACDGSEALVREDEVQPDAIVLDLEMPGMDGASLFRELRTRGETEPVLILSAYGARRVARELGAEDAMEKPFDPDELVSRVRTLVQSQDGRTP